MAVWGQVKSFWAISSIDKEIKRLRDETYRRSTCLMKCIFFGNMQNNILKLGTCIFFSKILSTLRSKVPFSFTSPKADSRCKSWKARCRLSVEEGQVLEDAVGIGVVDDAMYCDTLLFLSLHMWGVCLCMFVFGHTLLYVTAGEMCPGVSAFCHRVLR